MNVAFLMEILHQPLQLHSEGVNFIHYIMLTEKNCLYIIERLIVSLMTFKLFTSLT